MSTDTSLITFKAISNFTNSLAEIYSSKQRSLKLYAHLINKTTISHNKPINKHIEAFKKFCIDNREKISSKNTNLVNTKIVYSNRVFIDMENIFNISDKETTEIIWNHILIISALVDPTGKAKQILKENSKEETKGEVDFLNEIIGKVEEHTSPDDDPMKAVSSIMQSGVFTDLIQGMGNGLENGSLDIGKLMGTVQGMISTLNNSQQNLQGGSENINQEVPDLSGMMNMLNAGGIGNNNQEVPDLSGMMNMMGPMLGALTSNMSNSQTTNPNDIEKNINKQLEDAKKSGNLK
jgi:hypothetical protein